MRVLQLLLSTVKKRIYGIVKEQKQRPIKTLPFKYPKDHCFHTRIGPGGRIEKMENWIEILFFKHKEPSICSNFVNS